MQERLYYLKGINGQIEVYENKIVINRKGFIAHSAHGFAGSKTIPINSIQSIQYKPGSFFLNGFIQFAVLGGLEARGGLGNAKYDENTITIRKNHNNKALEIKEFIENKILTKYEDKNKNNQEQISVADEIVKYKQLLDNGVITQEEFKLKKKE